MAYVHNIKGTSNRAPKEFDSWIDFWEQHINQKAEKCSSIYCLDSTDDLVGAHVQKADKNDEKSWYIIPLCKACNHPSNTKTMLVSDEFLVPVNPTN